MTYRSLPPVGLLGWRPVPPSSLPATHKTWLRRPGARTAGLRALGKMGLRMLADMRYYDRAIRRSPFACALRAHPLALYRTVRGLDADCVRAPLWTRRSVFWRQSVPLLVAEYFLSNFWRDILGPDDARSPQARLPEAF